MIHTLQEARTALEAEGLLVSANGPTSLLVGGSAVEAEEGLRVFRDACCLLERGGLWVAVFPPRAC